VTVYAAQNTRSVFAPVASFQFSSAQMEDCRNFLANRTAHTECVPIVDEAQLLMSTAGRVAENGYRFNPIGFDALSKALSNGLSAMFNELSGEAYRGTFREDKPVNLAAAVSIYNTTMQVRFDSLRERTLLVNHAEKSIDGFLGLDHRMLDNTQFFDLIQREMADKQPQAEFSRAEIIGRELRIYYLDPQTRRDNIHPDPRHTFAAGWYFSNREDSGHAIRAALCAYTKFGAAVEPPHKNSKVVHMGSDLAGRTAVLVGRTAARSIDMAIVARQVKSLLSTPLNFSDNRKQFEDAVRYWAGYISKFKVRHELARVVAKNAAMVGADIEPRDAIDVYNDTVLKARNAYDLLCAILRQSRQEYATYRDLLQAMAMRMLMPDTGRR
jgi:hypothetical protein